MSDPISIIEQYGVSDFVARVERVLLQAGFGNGPISWQDLAPLDQFHVGGAAATTVLAQKLAIRPGATVLDIGCGLGGPSRQLASVYGCTVQGIDLNPSLIDVATMLTRRAGLADSVTHVTGDATELSFGPENFDFAWTQHVAMNIIDRYALYTGVYRMLRPGGLFAMFDVVAGEQGALHFPVPWARDPAASFLLAPEAMRNVLEACGFKVVEWIDATELGQAWFQTQAAATKDRPENLKPLALPLIMGSDFPIRTQNLGRNFQEGRARLLQAVEPRAEEQKNRLEQHRCFPMVQRPATQPGRRHRHRGLVQFRPAAGADPLGAGARPVQRARAISFSQHQSGRHTGRDARLVRLALAGGNHLSRGARASWRRDATSMVRSGDPAHHTGLARPVLADHRLGGRSGAHHKGRREAKHCCLVSQAGADLQRRNRRRPQGTMGITEFIHVPATE